jgi:hypothetical protein
MTTSVTGGILGAESGASFDEFVRSGRDKDLTNKGRGNGMRQSRLVPAVEYLQAQRVRAMIMRQFAVVVSKHDVYIAPASIMRAGGAGRAGRGQERREGRDGQEEAGRRGQAGRGEGALPPSAIRDHFQVANLCGYPAVSVPNGFTAEGRPTSITFLGRLTQRRRCWRGSRARPGARRVSPQNIRGSHETVRRRSGVQTRHGREGPHDFNMVQGFGLAICVALLPAALLGKSAPVADTKVDAVFGNLLTSTPGCAAG